MLGPEPALIRPGWSQREILHDLWLSSDPELNVVSVEGARASATLVGYALDVREPGASDVDIVTRLASVYDGIDLLSSHTASLAGRWVLVVDDDNDRYLVHDTLGLRQVFRTESGWCASSLDALQRHLGLEPSAEAMAYWEGGSLRWWPGDRTSLAGARRLPPNWAQSLTHGRAVRVAPYALDALEGMDQAARVRLLRDCIVGAMSAARQRFALLPMLTGGVDSRLMLAACRDFAAELSFVTIEGRTRESRNDADTAARLCARLGLRHVRLPAASEPTAAFRRAALEHSSLARPLYDANNEALLPVIGPETVGATGHGAEALRIYASFRLPDGVERNAESFAALSGAAGEPFAIEALADWLSTVDLPGAGQVDVVDRFYWEDRAASWLAGWLAEADLVWRDHFTPYSSRLAITAAHSLPIEGRGAELFTGFIRELWPELLGEKILGQGPRPLHRRVLGRIRRALPRSAHAAGR